MISTTLALLASFTVADGVIPPLRGDLPTYIDDAAVHAAVVVSDSEEASSSTSYGSVAETSSGESA